MKKVLALATLYALPIVVAAQDYYGDLGDAYSGGGGTGNLGPIKNLVASLGEIFNMLIPVLIALAVVIFFWGLITYIWKGAEGHKEGKNIMIAGLVALFIMVSVWGIIRLAGSALGVQNVNRPDVIPQVPTPR